MFQFRKSILSSIIIISSSSLSSFSSLQFISQTEDITNNNNESKCPVSFLWNWNGNKPTLPFNHPPINKSNNSNNSNNSSNLEQPVQFNSSHFPNGVNGNFLNIDRNSCAAKFAGPNGLFECESRQIKKYGLNIIKTLQLYGLREGSRVGDIGAGTGVMTRLLSKAVGPNGFVIAQEISPSFLTLLNEQRLQDSSLNNVMIIQGNEKEIRFPTDQKCDLILVCDVYHHFEYPITICRDIKSNLKPNGKLVVIDFHRDESKITSMPKGWVTEHLRASQEEFRKEIESAGFHLVAEPVIEGLTENYCMIFEPNP